MPWLTLTQTGCSTLRSAGLALKVDQMPSRTPSPDAAATQSPQTRPPRSAPQEWCMAPRLKLTQNGCGTLKSARLASKMDQMPSPTMSPDAAAMHSPNAPVGLTRNQAAFTMLPSAMSTATLAPM